MQMIYLLHSQLDERLVRRIRAKLGAGGLNLWGLRELGSEADGASRVEVGLTEEEIRGDLEFGRAA